MYVFDTCSLIQAYRDDFPPSGADGRFWDWLDSIAEKEGVYIPEKVFDEISKKYDGLKPFLIKHPSLKRDPTSNCAEHLQKVLRAYGALSDIDLERLEAKADPYVVAHSMALGATVISCENSQPNRIGVNKKIPDICRILQADFEPYAHFLWRMRGVYK